MFYLIVFLNWFYSHYTKGSQETYDSNIGLFLNFRLTPSTLSVSSNACITHKTRLKYFELNLFSFFFQSSSLTLFISQFIKALLCCRWKIRNYHYCRLTNHHTLSFLCHLFLTRMDYNDLLFLNLNYLSNTSLISLSVAVAFCSVVYLLFPGLYNSDPSGLSHLLVTHQDIFFL